MPEGHKSLKTPQRPSLLSTGQAAAACAVTPDTVLKWISSGRLPARRTAGGHHRIDHRDLERLVTRASRRDEPRRRPQGGQFQYCWEFKGKSGLLDGCKHCVVYALRAQRCYEVVKLAPEVGHSKLFCRGTCDQCDYFRAVRGQKTNVLVVTGDRELEHTLREAAARAPFNLELTDCEYSCSALVQSFRPDFAVVDCQMGRERSSDICAHLDADPRIPFVRIVLAGSPDEFPEDCDRLVFARIAKPFGLDEIAACTGGEGGFRAPS
ncbi:MAG: helix-turn-helix domain-containing protein [Deltaproteobacteria bacterium]|nr:helix-turn-helix domain-containing protein [Deltaproteobacteria bacterium]